MTKTIKIKPECEDGETWFVNKNDKKLKSLAKDVFDEDKQQYRKWFMQKYMELYEIKEQNEFAVDTVIAEGIAPDANEHMITAMLHHDIVQDAISIKAAVENHIICTDYLKLSLLKEFNTLDLNKELQDNLKTFFDTEENA